MLRPEITLLLLLTVATAVAITTKRLRIPYTVALVVVGLGLGATHLKGSTHLTKELLFAVFLPGLIFEAAYHLPFSEFRKNARAIVMLSVPGVVVAIGATAYLLVYAAPAFSTAVGLSHALVFSSLICATDPIAVVALFKSLGAPRRLGILIEGESLVNDGTAVVLFTIVLGAVSGGGFSVLHGVLDFGRIVGMGVGIGMLIGFASALLLRQVNDAMIEITVSTLVAYGSFTIAEELHASGVIATVTAGMFFGSYAAPRTMGPQTRVAVEAFWEYVAFVLNSLVFLLIGLAVSVQQLIAAYRPILLAFLAVLVARAFVVFVATVITRPTTERIPWRWSLVLTWGGLRGALSMVLALSLAPDFPNRDLIVTMTFGVVILSIVLQGVTAGPLLRKLGLAGAPAASPSSAA